MTRPRKQAAAKQSIKVVLHLTPSEKRALDRAASKMGLPVATVARLFTVQGAAR